MQHCVRRALLGSSSLTRRGLIIARYAGSSTAARLHVTGPTSARLTCSPSVQLMPHKQLKTHHPESPRAKTRTHATGVAASDTMKKHVLVPVANGSEEMEAVIIIDVLRRAGAEVTVASVEKGLEVTCARGVKLVADELITTAAQRDYDLVALPGGIPGAERLRDSAPLEQLVKAQKDADKLYAAICATPAVFFQAKGIIGPDQKVTAHPAFEKELKNQSAIAERVVVDGKLTTSRGPGTAFEFALALVQQLYGEDKAAAVAKPMVMYPNQVVAH